MRLYLASLAVTLSVFVGLVAALELITAAPIDTVVGWALAQVGLLFIASLLLIRR